MYFEFQQFKQCPYCGQFEKFSAMCHGKRTGEHRLGNKSVNSVEKHCLPELLG